MSFSSRHVLLLALAGCAVEALEPSSDVIVQSVGCPPGECASNSPNLGGVWFHDLSRVSYTPNAEGFFITGMVGGNGQTYALSVTGGRISGSNSNGRISGQGLVNSIIYVRRTGSSNLYAVKIEAVESSISYWATSPNPPNGVQPKVEMYKMRYTEYDGRGQQIVAEYPLCDHAIDSWDRNTYLTMNGMYLVVFEGERIDEAQKRIVGFDTSWFNLGCAGNILAKMHLDGHTAAAAVGGFDTTIDERQTMMKMFAADYCGAGYAFTVFGQPLAWRDDDGTLAYQLAPASLEARWTPEGATCVGIPRVTAHPTAASMAQFGADKNVWDDVLAHCATPPPRCWDAGWSNDPNVQAGAHLVTANPK